MKNLLRFIQLHHSFHLFSVVVVSLVVVSDVGFVSSLYRFITVKCVKTINETVNMTHKPHKASHTTDLKVSGLSPPIIVL